MGLVSSSALLLVLGSLSFGSSNLEFRLGDIEATAWDLAGELRGEGIRLEWEEDQNYARGVLFSSPVSLVWGDGVVSGTIGDETVALRVREIGAEVLYRGSIGGRAASGSLAPSILVASMGECTAVLGTGWTGYEGLLDCGAVVGQQPFALAFPRSLSSVGPEGQAALTAILVWAAERFQGAAPAPASAEGDDEDESERLE
jgi:hypothetical protein